MSAWKGFDSEVAEAVKEQNERLVETYRTDPKRLEEDANTERSSYEGAYRERQLHELLQNAADAMRTNDGRCEVLLTDHTLYVANTGDPLTVQGVDTLMAAHLSSKRDEQIGRFGLGFKSVLAVTDTPRIYSRSGSLGFDRAWAREKLAAAIPGQPYYPVARLAQPLDATDDARSDSVLAAMMKWATTVVVLPHLTGRDQLADSVRIFPAEFLLFSQHVARLDLEDRAKGNARRITLNQGEDGLLRLDDAGRKSKWVVASRRHTPSPEALKDGGYQASREVVELTWAAPVDGVRHRVGSCWAYFPTAEVTTLSGIINAPWKLTDDRARLLPGRFNNDLLKDVLPGVVATALPQLVTSEHPAAAIDALPARGKEMRGYADSVLGEPVISAVARARSVPNMSGDSIHPGRARLHPEVATAEELEIWAGACPDPERWVHHSIMSPERRSKVLRLMGAHDRGATGPKPWVEHLAKRGSVEGSAAAVRIVASMIDRDPGLRPELEKARVLLLEDGSIDAPRRGQVFLPGGNAPAGSLVIDSVLAADPDVVSALQGLGIEIFDDAGELRSELAGNPIRWDRVWSAARRLEPEEAERIFRESLGNFMSARLRARTYSGKWKGPGEVFLPGAIIPGDGIRDGDFVVDHRFHRHDLELLADLGFVDQPHRSTSSPDEPWRTEFARGVRRQFRDKTHQPRLRDDQIEIDHGSILWPLEFMPRLSQDARMAISRAALRSLEGEEKWTIRRVGGGKSFSITSPAWKRLADFGCLSTEVGCQPIRRCLMTPADDIDEADRVCLPYVIDPVTAQQAAALRLNEDAEDLLSDDWAGLLREAAGWDHERRFQLYAWAAFYDQSPPDRIRVDKGRGHTEVPPSHAAVTARDDIYESLLAAGEPVLKARTQEDAETLVDAWDLAVGEAMLVETVNTETSGERYLASDRFPPLAHLLGDEWDGLEVQPCTRIELLTRTTRGEVARSLPSRLDGHLLYVVASDEREVLSEISRATDTSFPPRVVLERMERQRLSQLVAKIAAEEDVLEKLILAIGAEDLRSSIPAAALAAMRDNLGRDLTSYEVAQLALAVDGYAVLESHTRRLQENKLDPPSQWAGRSAARALVRRLGFPIEFAGFAGSERAREIEVEGPPVLGELHDFQAKIAERIKQLFTASARTNRGLVCLPTGAGKTRVAVQALVEYLTEAKEPNRIVWVAETDELCEQAVQTWAEVWRAHGWPGEPLSLHRLWAANEINEREGIQVVVASASKLASIVDRRDWLETYGWLRSPAMVVIDEAHKSIGKQYTSILTALAGTQRVLEMEIPLLGLTATPFRGFNEEETTRLIRRYDRRLDEEVFGKEDVYVQLQRVGVLASIHQEELTGADITLTEEEKERADQFNRLSDRVAEELSANEKRNNTIVESVAALPDDTKVLLFATSVENARVLSALLSYRGVQTRAVSAGTSAAARRRYIEDFRSGKVRVLTNYNVFTEGFDVPAVDAVYITRPTFSPNVYQQMIGRGLRGPLNGGSEEVLIVNVADNLTNFGKEFAFHHFDHLWKDRA